MTLEGGVKESCGGRNDCVRDEVSTIDRQWDSAKLSIDQIGKLRIVPSNKAISFEMYSLPYYH